MGNDHCVWYILVTQQWLTRNTFMGLHIGVTGPNIIISVSLYLHNYITVRNRDFYVPAHRGGFRACCGWILSNGVKPCLLIILLSVFLSLAS